MEIKKNKGPVRTEALFSIAIVYALFYVYFHFFFDSHMRRGMEYIFSQIHGAEVDIANIHSSFWGASFELNGLEVTDKSNTSQNAFEIGKIRLELSWDALLRAKAVINDASILNIQAQTKRSKPGYLLPPPPKESSLLGKVQNEIYEQTKKRINENFLGDIVDVLQGADPKAQLESIKADLKSTQLADQLEAQLTSKKAEWEKRLKELPKPAEIKELEAKIKQLPLNSKNPSEIASALKQAKDLLAQAKQKVDTFNKAQSDFTQDTQNYAHALSELQSAMNQDVNDLQKRFKLPNLDPKEISTQLFLSQIESKLVGVRKYIAIARKYMPPKKSREQIEKDKAEAILPRKRGEGVNYTFPITTGYPLFWLKKAAISSQVNQSEWAGNFFGEIKNFSTDPRIVSEPSTIQLTGEFPKKNILGIDIKATLDHRSETPKESLLAKVHSYPVENFSFSQTEKIKMGIASATATSELQANLWEENFKLEMKNNFQKSKFFLQANSNQVQSILEPILNGIPTISMNATIQGTWANFHIDIDSNLGKEIGSGFQKIVSGKLGDAKAKLNSFVEQKVAPQKEKIKSLLGGLNSGPGSALNKGKSEMDSALNSATNSASPKAGGNILDKGKGLLKGFGL